MKNKKNIIQKSQNLILNLKLLPFISIKQTREFYLKIKEYFDEGIFENFYFRGK